MTIDVTVIAAKGGYVDVVDSGGAVSSVDAIGCTGLTVTGGPITTSGTFIFTLGTELQALSGLSSTGLVTRTAANTYVERSIAIGSANLTLSNGSGVSGNPTIDLATTLSGLSLITTNSITINNSPVNPTDGSNKAYVDLVAAGFQFKSSCYCATTANLTATYANGTGGVGATLTNSGTLAAISIDGQSPALNARVLVKDQTTTYQNGIYTVTTVGSGSVAWVLTRATDFDQPIEIQVGDLVPVQNGTINLDTVWLQTSTVTAVGTDAIVFTQFLYSPNYFLKVASNLSDVASASTSRSNLGLTNVAIQNVTNHSALVGGASNAITSIALTNGQLLIGSTSADPVAAVPTNGTNISWSTGAGSLTANISGQIALTNGGTGASLSASNGGIFYSTGSAGAILAGTAIANKMLLSGASTTPSWSTSTIPSSAGATANVHLISNGTNYVLGALTYPNSATLGDTYYASSTTAISILAGNTTSTKKFFTQTGTGAVSAAPGWNTIVAADVPASNLTKVDDTNVTITIGTAACLLAASSLTMGWSGQLSLTRGGTGASLSASNGGIFYSTGSTGAILSGTSTANQVLLSGLSTAPSWSTATYPATTTINQILFSSAANTIGGITTGNNGVLITSGGGVPSISSTLPSAVQGNITSVGTVTSGTWNGSVIDLAHGGTGASLSASNGGIFYSTGSVGAILSGTAVANQILLSGASGAPAWSTVTHPATTTINQILYSSSANTIAGLATANSGVLVTSSGGVPSISSTLPSIGIGVAPSANAELTVSSTLAYNTLIQGTQTAQTIGDQIALSIQSTLAPAAAITGYVAAISVNPTITVPNVTNPAIVAGYGVYVNLTVNGTALKVLTDCYGVFVVPITLGTATITNSYGGYFSNPAVGTNKCAIYSDDISIGYVATTPPSHGLIVSGNVSIGSSSATSLFNVGSSNQFQVGSTGIVTSGTWNGSVVDLTHGGTGAALTASNGGIFYSTGSTGAILSGTSTANQILLSGASGAPAWSTVTHPATTTINRILYSSAANIIGEITSANNGVLITSATGVPSFLANGTTSQVLIATTSSPPSWTNLSSIGVSSLTGTANQVLVSLTSGTPQIGDLTLTLPQNIDTAASVQFGSIGINIAPNVNNQLRISSALAHNIGLTGTQTAQSGNVQAAILIGSVLAPTATISLYVAGIVNTPTITIPTGTNPTIAAGYGEYINLTVNGIAAKHASIISGIFVDSGSLATAIVNAAYGGYFSNPAFGTSACALYADNASIGYTATTPPTNGLMVAGNVGINANPVTNLDVGGNIKRQGNITVSETITSAGALSTTLDSIIDTTTNGAYTVTLAGAGFADQLKVVRLLTRFSGYATVSCSNVSGPMGSFNLTPSEPTRVLRYVSNGTNNYWSCESSFSPGAPDSFYVTTQQAGPLVGTGATNPAVQGCSVSLSADGNTMAVGGYTNNSSAGAVWIYTRSAGAWSQQGSKLVGTGATNPAAQGWSVSLSADGNTLAVGAEQNASNAGAVWIWTRSGTSWSQQAGPLTGTGATGAASQGFSVSLSADGNTLAVGGDGNNSNAGAVWVWLRSSGVWSQQAGPLVGTGATGASKKGFSVSLSADGNTMAVGGPQDNSGAGGIWIWTRSGTSWAQQAGPLVGTGVIGAANQGYAVSLSADGNTLASGNPADSSNSGTVIIWTRSNGSWTQQSSPLFGTGTVGSPKQGFSVSLSADGNVLAFGGPVNNSNAGGIWQFVRSGGNWTQQGGKLLGTGATGTTSQQGFYVSLSSSGNTLASGGQGDNSSAGAVWVWT